MNLSTFPAEPGSASRQAAWELRKRVLLDPFSIDHDLARQDDPAAQHFVAMSGKRCLACLLMIPRALDAVQMRQVAVEPSWRRRGLGKQLVEAAEQWALSAGYARVFAHARLPALPFYESLGYRIVSEPYEEVGILHRTVDKWLSPPELEFEASAQNG